MSEKHQQQLKEFREWFDDYIHDTTESEASAIIKCWVHQQIKIDKLEAQLREVNSFILQSTDEMWDKVELTHKVDKYLEKYGVWSRE